MKLIAIFLLAYVFLLNSQAAITEEKEDIGYLKKQAIIECSNENNISKDDIKNILNHVNMPDNEEVKCWLSCVLKKLGIMKEGKLDWEKCKSITKLGLTVEDKAKVDKIVEICQAEVPKDEANECHLAYSAAVCKIKKWNEFDLPKKSWGQD